MVIISTPCRGSRGVGGGEGGRGNGEKGRKENEGRRRMRERERERDRERETERESRKPRLSGEDRKRGDFKRQKARSVTCHNFHTTITCHLCR